MQQRQFILKAKDPITLSNLFSWQLLAWLLFLLLAIPFRVISFPFTGIDASWRIAINLAHAEKLMFGKEFVFTYGPLGYLDSGLPDHIPVVFLVLFKVFLLGYAVWFVRYIQQNLENKMLFWFLLPVFLLFNFLFSAATDLLLYFFIVVQLLLFSKSKKPLALYLAVLLTALSLYVKVSTGMVTSILLVLSLVYFLIAGWGNKKHLLIAAGLFVLLNICLCWWLHVAFIPYVKNSLEFILYYPDAMYLHPSYTKLIVVTGVAIIALTGLVLVINFRTIWKDKRELFLFGQVFIFLFIVFKQSFVRADEAHLPSFFLSSVYVLLLFYLFSGTEKVRSSALAILPLVLLLNCVPDLKKDHFFNNVKQHANQVINYTAVKENFFVEQKKKVQLPERMRSEIGKKNIDIFPTEISYAYFNQLSYSPRPVIQSYAAYSPALLKMNYAAYLSASAPEYVLYHFSQIPKERYFLWDDMYAQLALLQHYKVVDSAAETGKELLLFKKNSVVKPLTKKLLLDTIVGLNRRISIPQTTQLLFMECDLAYTLPGKLRSFFYQPPSIYLQLQRIDQTSQQVKAILPILKTGVLLNKSFQEKNGQPVFDELYSFFVSHESFPSKVESIRFQATSNMVKDNFRVKFWEYSL